MGWIKDILQSRRKKIVSNRRFKKIEHEFHDEISSFSDFKQLSMRKRQIIKRTRALWTNNWKEAEDFLSHDLPRIIRNQKRCIEQDMRLIQEEGHMIRLVLKEHNKNSIITNIVNNKLASRQRSVAAEVENDLRIILKEGSVSDKFHILHSTLAQQEDINIDDTRERLEKLSDLINHEIHTMEEIDKILSDTMDRVTEVIRLKEEEIRIKEERIRAEEERESLLKKKVHVSSVDSDIPLHIMLKIVKGALPLVYYHSTSLEFLDIIFDERCLIPNKRLEYLRKIKDAKASSDRRVVAVLTQEYRYMYETEMDKFRKLVKLKAECEATVKKMAGDLGFERSYKIMEDEESISRFMVYNVNNLLYNPLNMRFAKVIINIYDLIRKKLILTIEGKNYSFIDKRLRAKKEQLKFDLLSLYETRYNIRRGTGSQGGDEQEWKAYAKKDTQERRFRKYHEHFYDYVYAKCILQIIEKAQRVPMMQRLSDEEQARRDKLNMFKIRDRWFVFFAADQPFRTRETFDSCIRYGSSGGIGFSVQVIFEFKPAIYNMIEWGEKAEWIGEPGKPMDADMFPAASQGKISYDIITKKRVDLRFLSRIYTSEDNYEEVKKKMDLYSIKVPLHKHTDQRKDFHYIMNEMEQILRHYNLL